MGTETRPLLNCDYSFLQFVKLNNPLMGTETSDINILFHALSVDFVKLNNPLMGTETYKLFNVPIIFAISIVKLNNPLMGTETYSFL